MRASPRIAEHAIDAQFIQRWSPRAFTGEQIDEGSLLSIFEAARWAPSAFNAQPWRFLYARRDTPNWSRYLKLLNPANRDWAQQAGALVLVLSKTCFAAPCSNTEMPLPSHSFDAGAAWAHLSLQANLLGWHTHAMAGFDAAQARSQLGIPDEFALEIVVAIGKLGDKANLPETLRAREIPSPRRPLNELVGEGNFRF